jgi:hypothetical protein
MIARGRATKCCPCFVRKANRTLNHYGEKIVTHDERLLQPERLDHVAAMLDEAVGAFRSWGITVGETNRLLRISKLLVRTAAEAAYPRDEERLSVLAESIRNAQEFIEIATVLPAEPIASVKHDLRKAIRGDLVGSGGPTGPHLQHQTQLWVGAMLAQAYAKVGVLMQPGGEKNPDFILSNGTLQYAVEVKRPNGGLDAYNTVRKAVRQIRSPKYHGGMIVVDLTDCIDLTDRYTCRSGSPDFSGVRDKTNYLLHDLHREVFEDTSEFIKPGREQVFGIIGFCRATHWDLEDLSVPHLLRYVGTVLYWRRDHRTLRAVRARWLTDLIHNGISAAGHRQSGASAIEGPLESE